MRRAGQLQRQPVDPRLGINRLAQLLETTLGVDRLARSGKQTRWNVSGPRLVAGW
jgi:hypothetical protein